MDGSELDALVVGHLCLDIIPSFPNGGAPLAEMLRPGKLVDIGDAVLGTGGAASNTGLALHRLGFRVGIASKIGDDFFGRIVLDILKANAPHLVEDMIVSGDSGTSYSIILNPPGYDRAILHSSAANHTFCADDVPEGVPGRARLAHFGYPPLMRRFWEDDGAELKKLFRRARAEGATTSLDMARPDPDGPSGRVDWPRFLENVMPEVDVFLPSVDELLFMTEPDLFASLCEKAGDGNPAAHLDVDQLRGAADRLLDMGAAIVGLKLGDQGFYLRTTDKAERLRAAGRARPNDEKGWLDREVLAGCRQVEVAGTIGAGDCTIAGFLGALLKGLDADMAATMAVCVGAASVESRDANTGVGHWEVIEARRAAGWPQAPGVIVPDDWPTTPAGNRTRPST